MPSKKFKENSFKVAPEKLRWNCPLDYFKFSSTKEVEPLKNIVGQPRAIEAIRLGAALHAKGYNIFVTGLSGTGRLTTVKNILEEVTNSCPITYDYCYVNNFAKPDEPRLVKLQKGKGKEFAEAMDDAIDFIRRRLPKLFEEENYQKSRIKIIEEYQSRERALIENFDDKIRPYHFMRGQLETQQGAVVPEVFPIVDGKPVTIDTIEELLAEKKITKKEAIKIKELWRQFHDELFELVRENMKIMQEFRKAIIENDKKHSEIVVSSVLDEIVKQFNNEKVKIYIEEVKKYILDHLNLFVPIAGQLGNFVTMQEQTVDEDVLRLFTVNVILDNSTTETAPVITETTPSYNNLFGTIERVFDKRGGYWRTDFTKIKAGSVLKADQGYLIVNANDLFSEPGVWTALKRVLLYDKLEIQTFDAYFQFSQASLKPEPIDVNVKVIIIGGLTLYHLLFHYEKGFKKIFKVHAQFDYETDKTQEMIDNFTRFIAKICNSEGLPHCSPDGVAAIIEWAVETAGSQNKITLKFSDVADILREAAYYDTQSNNTLITREVVEKAIQWRHKRNDLLDEKIKKSILEGDMLIDTEGKRIGQINGLTVYNNGFITFGKPARITASISVGNAGIINVEREAQLSGNIHNKAVLILAGFLREKFAQKRPLSLTASIAFEQSYGGIDGDSATAAEIYIILSAIAQVPIKQSLAITGSVDQKGNIQPIGGVNEKIRGFFEVCHSRGLTGEQGVIIPQQNVKDLMLPKNIIEAVKEEKFHIFAINNIDEGVEILMDIPAGKLTKNGNYPKNSLYGKVNAKLDEMYKIAKVNGEKKL
jgi:lon-related putative ATP-dependent protease